MPETKEKHSGLSPRSALIVAVISALVGGAGGPFLLVKFGANPFRADPFTGVQGQLLEARVTNLETHVENHPDQTNKFDRRITTLEVNQQIIIRNQERMLNEMRNGRGK